MRNNRPLSLANAAMRSNNMNTFNSATDKPNHAQPGFPVTDYGTIYKRRHRFLAATNFPSR